MFAQHRISISALGLTIIFGLLFGANYYLYPETVSVPRLQISPDSLKIPPEITHGDRTKQQVIFTFDGGSDAQSGDAILATLKKHGVKGTFFLTGKFVLHNQALVKRIAAEGHEIFNHSYDHPHFTDISTTEMVGQLRHMNTILRMTISSSTVPYFRPPYGARDERVLKAAATAGYQSVYWTVDARDWMAGEDGKATGAISDDEVRDRILSNVSPGAIYLMHLGDPITGRILDDVFTTIENRGYKMVSLTQGI